MAGSEFFAGEKWYAKNIVCKLLNNTKVLHVHSVINNHSKLIISEISWSNFIPANHQFIIHMKQTKLIHLYFVQVVVQYHNHKVNIILVLSILVRWYFNILFALDDVINYLN